MLRGKPASPGLQIGQQQLPGLTDREDETKAGTFTFRLKSCISQWARLLWNPTGLKGKPSFYLTGFSGPALPPTLMQAVSYK